MDVINRRNFLVRSGLALGTALIASEVPFLSRSGGLAATPSRSLDWQAVRDQFPLSRDLIHLSGFYLASHPTPVREAIERHRRGLDDNPLGYHHQHAGDCEHAVREAAGDYLGATTDDIMLTDSTTMGLGLLYGNLTLREGQEILTTEHDHYSTHRSLELRAERTDAKIRDVRLYKRSGTASVDEIVSAIRGRMSPKTRVVAVTWVHSSTGVKLPIRAIADVITEANRGRDSDDRAVLCVDGVHGLGIEDVTMAELGC